MEKQDFIKERNELAKQLLNQMSANVKEAWVMATDLMERLYGDDWTTEGRQENEVNPACGCKNPSVSLHTDESGVKWIRVKALDEDFLLSLHNMRDGDKDRFTWDEAMKFAESQGQELPSKKQWMLVDMLRDDIDRLIEENGGDPLKVWYWSKDVAQCNANYAWLYSGYYGTLNRGNKYSSYGGRSLVYL